jgi:nucleotide-binding universal stress UspA family protein
MAKILVAYDGSEPAKHALDRATWLPHDEGVWVISVVPVILGAGRGGGIDPTSGVEDHRRMLDEAAAILASRGVEARAIEAVGHPADAILRVAQDEGFDIVVLGSRGLNAVERFVMGSVSTRVVTHAHCDVLVVR